MVEMPAGRPLSKNTQAQGKFRQDPAAHAAEPELQNGSAPEGERAFFSDFLTHRNVHPSLVS